MVHFEGYMLIVKNAQQARKFYEDVLQLSVKLDLGKHVIFDAQFFLLEESDWCDFSQIDNKHISYGHNAGELTFEVEDIDAFMKHLNTFTDIRKIHDVKMHPWGRRAVRFYDKDGHIIEVGESMQVVVKRFLLEGMSVEEAAQKSEFPISFAQMCLTALQKEGKI